MVCLLVRIKKTDPLKTQVASHMYSEYKKKRYPKTNGASV